MLDTDGLTIMNVTDQGGIVCQWYLTSPNAHIGSALVVTLNHKVGEGELASIKINYHTNAMNRALTWGDNSVFSDCHPISCRGISPMQDAPRFKVRTTAKVTAPKNLHVQFAGGFVGAMEEGALKTSEFKTEAVPPSSLGFMAGQLEVQNLGGIVVAAAPAGSSMTNLGGLAGGLVGALSNYTNQTYPYNNFTVVSMPKYYPKVF